MNEHLLVMNSRATGNQPGTGNVGAQLAGPRPTRLTFGLGCAALIRPNNMPFSMSAPALVGTEVLGLDPCASVGWLGFVSGVGGAALALAGGPWADGRGPAAGGDDCPAAPAPARPARRP